MRKVGGRCSEGVVVWWWCDGGVVLMVVGVVVWGVCGDVVVVWCGCVVTCCCVHSGVQGVIIWPLRAPVCKGQIRA